MAEFTESSMYRHGNLRQCHAYVLPDLQRMMAGVAAGARVLDVGCGNGSLTAELGRMGYDVTGVDLSAEGVEQARLHWPQGRFEVLAADDGLLAKLGVAPFDLVCSVEVIEHLYDPAALLDGCLQALRPGGMLLVSTPYHGYLKNLAISLAGGWDKHADPLKGGGHIKFYSMRTLREAAVRAGFERFEIIGSGRLPGLWKSMILRAYRPE